MRWKDTNIRRKEKRMLSNLIGQMKERKISQLELARTLGISNVSVAHKLRGKTDFTLTEIFKIRDTYFPERTIEWLFKKMEV